MMNLPARRCACLHAQFVQWPIAPISSRCDTKDALFFFSQFNFHSSPLQPQLLTVCPPFPVISSSGGASAVIQHQVSPIPAVEAPSNLEDALSIISQLREAEAAARRARFDAESTCHQLKKALDSMSSAHAAATSAAAIARAEATKSAEICRGATEENKALKTQIEGGEMAKRRVVSLEFQVEELQRQLEVQKKMVALADQGDRGGDALLMHLKHECKNLRLRIDGLQLELDSKEAELHSSYSSRSLLLQAADVAAARERVKDAMVGSIFKRADVFRQLFEQEHAAVAARAASGRDVSEDAQLNASDDRGLPLEVAIALEGGPNSAWVLDDDAVSCISQYICASVPRGVHCTSLTLTAASTSSMSISSLSLCTLNNIWLTCITLTNMPFGIDGVNMIAPSFGSCSNLTSLLLSACDISDAEVGSLVGCLQGHPKLQQLGLRSNCITDAGAEQLAHLLRSCPCLADLSLHHNAVSDEGACALVSVIDDHRLHRVKLLRLTRNPLTSRTVRVILGRERPAKIYWDST